MRALLRYFSLRHMLRHRMRVALALVAVALGVALFVSSDVSNASVRASFEATMRELAGKAEWQVSRGRALGVEESLLQRVKEIPGAVAAPLIQASVALPELKEGPLLVLGIDFWKDSPLRLYKFEGAQDLQPFVAAAFVPGAIIPTRRFGERHGLQVGSRLKVSTREGTRELRVTGFLAHEGPARIFGGNVALMELHSAQKLFGRPGFVDRIEVAGVDPEVLRRAVGTGYSVDPVIRGSSTLEDALARIQSLVVVSLIALLVGMLIIYQTVSISVLERVKEIGILRALGATRRQITAALVLEWALLGLAGAAAGIGLGYAFARGLVAYTAGTINAMVMLVDVTRVELTPFAVAGALVAGTLTTLIAAVIPARRAASLPVVDLLRAGIYGTRNSPHYRAHLFFGIASAAVGCGLILVSASHLPRHAGLLSSVLVFAGIALALPQMTLWLSRGARPALRRIFKIEGYLASDNLAKFPQRTALTVVSLGGALAMMVSAAALIEGFGVGARRWMDQAFPFDLTVSATDFSSTIYSQNLIPESTRDEVRAVPGVQMAYGMQKIFADFRGQDVMIIAFDTDEYLRMRQARGMAAWSPRMADPEAMRQFRSGEGIFISENMGAQFGLRVGETIELPTPRGNRRFRVLDELEDYSWPRGLLAMDRSAYQELWNDPNLTYVDLRVDPSADRNQVRADLARALSGKVWVFVYDVADLKKIADETMRQTVQLANMQVIIALSIGFLGIVNTLLISVLRRTREIGLLRALGMTRGQIARTVVIEAVFVAVAGGLIGVLGGLLGAALPIRLHTFQITGYWAPFAIPWPSTALAMMTAVILGFVASIVPALRASRLGILESIGYE